MNWSYDSYMAYARGVVHDAANPMNAISMHLELLELLLQSNPKGVDVLKRARDDMHRALATVRRAVYLPDLPIESAATSIVLRESIEDAWTIAGADEHRLRCEVPDDVQVHASPSLLQQALIQLLANAEAFGTGDIRCTLVGSALKIRNSIPSAVSVDSWLQPGFSSRRKAGHLGLGLNIARGALETFGAALELYADDATCTAMVAFSEHG